MKIKKYFKNKKIRKTNMQKVLYNIKEKKLWIKKIINQMRILNVLYTFLLKQFVQRVVLFKVMIKEQQSFMLQEDMLLCN
jgi:hypothetical protein